MYKEIFGLLRFFFLFCLFPEKSAMNRSSVDRASYIPKGPSQDVSISIVVLLTIVFLTGTVGNARVCVLLRRRHDLRKVPHFLLASLSLTGFLSSLIKLPAHLAVIIVNYFFVYKISLDVICKLGFSSAMGFTVLNAITLSLMAIDRYDCVARPLYRRLSPSNVKRVILLVWIVALLLSSVHGVMLHLESSTCFHLDPCSSSATSSGIPGFTVYTMFLGTLSNVTAVMIITFTLCLIVKKLRSSILPRLGSLNRRREHEITKFTYKICGVFLLCWFPVIICNIVIRIGGFHGEMIRKVKLFAVVISNFNYVLNPMLHFKVLQVRLPDGARLRSVLRSRTATAQSRVQMADK